MTHKKNEAIKGKAEHHKELNRRMNNDGLVLNRVKQHLDPSEFEMVVQIIKTFQSTCLYKVVNEPKGESLSQYKAVNGYVQQKRIIIPSAKQQSAYGEVYFPIAGGLWFTFTYELMEINVLKKNASFISLCLFYGKVESNSKVSEIKWPSIVNAGAA